MKTQISNSKIASIVGALFGIGLVFGLSLFKPPQSIGEILFYCMSNDLTCRTSFDSNYRSIHSLGLLGYMVNGEGDLRLVGNLEMVAHAHSKEVAVIPLIFNGQFDQEIAHSLLKNEVAQANMIGEMVKLAKQHGYKGWQMDFENVNVSERDRLTQFYRKIAKAMVENNLLISIAVVPRTTETDGTTPYSSWLFQNWSGVYDYAAYTQFVDFITLMAYDQHTKRTPPGPIAAIQWVDSCLKHLQSLGVNMQKVSLGIPVYSHRWYSSFDKLRLGFMTGKQIRYSEAMHLIENFKGEMSWSKNDAGYFSVLKNENWNEVLALEEIRSFREKIKLVPRFNLRGISVFRLGWEDPRIWGTLQSR